MLRQDVMITTQKTFKNIFYHFYWIKRFDASCWSSLLEQREFSSNTVFKMTIALNWIILIINGLNTLYLAEGPGPFCVFFSCLRRFSEDSLSLHPKTQISAQLNSLRLALITLRTEQIYQKECWTLCDSKVKTLI